MLLRWWKQNVLPPLVEQPGDVRQFLSPCCADLKLLCSDAEEYLVGNAVKLSRDQSQGQDLKVITLKPAEFKFLTKEHLL